MRKSLRDQIMQNEDAQEQLKEAERLVREGELQEFLVGDQRVTFIDPKGDPKEEARLHIDTQQKLQGRMLGARFDKNPQEEALYKDAINRLYGIYPDLPLLVQEYEASTSEMRREWNR